MIPSKIFHHAPPRRLTHALNNFGMAIQILDRGSNGIDISRLHNDPLDAVAYYVARFARGDYRQAASCSFVDRLGAAFQTRRKNVYRSLIEIILGIAYESEDSDVVAPKFFQVRFCF